MVFRVLEMPVCGKNGMPVPAQLLDDQTDLYVEGSSTILGGPGFGDVTVKMSYENGALQCDTDGAHVALQKQQDGFLRLTAAFPSAAPQTFYFTLAYELNTEDELE